MRVAPYSSPAASTVTDPSTTAAPQAPLGVGALDDILASFRAKRLQLGVKRGVDVAIALIGLTLCAPLLAVIAVAVLLDSGRPIFFRPRRFGKEGRVFTMLKFRTMVREAEERLPALAHLNVANGMVKIPNDPRITRVGRWLRRFSLDELPQLWNVLRGDMSLVGPRPHDLQDIPVRDPIHRARLAMKPGLTGLWQVTYRNHPELAIRVRQDLVYLAQWSLWLDLTIALQTPLVVLRAKGGQVWQRR